MAAIDWLAIKTDYLCGSGSYRELAVKYGVSASWLMEKGAREHWTAQRRQLRKEMEEKTRQLMVEKGAQAASETAAVRQRVNRRMMELIEQSLEVIEPGDAGKIRQMVQSWRDICDIPGMDADTGDSSLGVVLIPEVQEDG